MHNLIIINALSFLGLRRLARRVAIPLPALVPFGIILDILSFYLLKKISSYAARLWWRYVWPRISGETKRDLGWLGLFRKNPRRGSNV